MSRPLTPEELCSLIDSHFSTLVLFARQWSRDAAEDLVQDAFMQLVKRSPWEGRPEQPVAWLFQVVRNAAIDRHRRESRRQKHEENAAEQRPVWFETPPAIALRAEEIDMMLESLDPEKREIVVARIWGGLTFDEIAALLRQPRTTVYRHYTEALELMKKRYGNEEN